jgi:cation diffusion facilitator family transporter
VAAELASQALAALARDNRSDALTSLLVIFGVGGSWARLGWAEAIVTALIGVLISAMGWKSLRDSMDVLMDRAPDGGMRARVEAASRSVAGVREVDRVRIHPLGSKLRIDLEIAVDGELSVRKGHEIAHEVERAVKQHEEHVVQVTVHVQPAGGREHVGTGL